MVQDDQNGITGGKHGASLLLDIMKYDTKQL